VRISELLCSLDDGGELADHRLSLALEHPPDDVAEQGFVGELPPERDADFRHLNLAARLAVEDLGQSEIVAK
jgi:hypothetical protein